jgi:hypothetical protein
MIKHKRRIQLTGILLMSLPIFLRHTGILENWSDFLQGIGVGIILGIFILEKIIPGKQSL